MKKIYLSFILISSLFLYNCIGEDIINDTIPEEIRFLNPIKNISVSETYQLNVRYFNNIGVEETVNIMWTSEDTSIATVDSNGLVTGVSMGVTTIKAQTLVGTKTVENNLSITITANTTELKSEEIIFLNPVESIAITETYQYNVAYYNSLGEQETVNITWSSEDTSIATVDSNGLVTGISMGVTTIKAQTLVGTKTIENTTTITITQEAQNSNKRSGTIVSTSNYALKGDFTLEEIENTNNLKLSLASNYEASTSLPGLYIYLSNNPNSIANALEIGPVSIFTGAHSYTITNKGINDYSYVLYWCKPFNVKVGEGKIND